MTTRDFDALNVELLACAAAFRTQLKSGDASDVPSLLDRTAVIIDSIRDMALVMVYEPDTTLLVTDGHGEAKSEVTTEIDIIRWHESWRRRLSDARQDYDRLPEVREWQQTFIAACKEDRALLTRILSHMSVGDQNDIEGWIAEARSQVDAWYKAGKLLVEAGYAMKGLSTIESLDRLQRSSLGTLNAIQRSLDALRDSSPQSRTSLVPVGGLVTHEGSLKGHTIDRHIGRSVAELQLRLSTEPALRMASSFSDRTIAERAIAAGIVLEYPAIEKWLAGKVGIFRIVTKLMPWPVGVVIFRDREQVVQAYRFKCVLLRDRDSPTGFIIRTAYPTI